MSTFSTKSTGRFTRASLAIGGTAFTAALLVFVGAVLGFGGGIISFTVLVYTFLGMGALGLVGAFLALVAFFRSPKRPLISGAGLVLNTALAVIGSTFLMMLPK